MPRSRKSKGKRGKQAARNPGGYQGAPVAGLSVPKPFLTLEAAGTANGSNRFRARGCEVIAQVASTSNFTVFRQSALNPGNPNLAPRLQAMALMFEKYRFLKFGIEYHPGCPTVQSGAVGIMVDFDPTDPAPSSLVTLAQNECAAVGTVAFPLRVSATFNSNDPWYYVTSMASPNNTNAVQQWEHQGRMFICTDQAASSSNALFAGYLSISYEIEFLRLRPVTQTVAAGNIASKAVTGGASIASQVMDIGWQSLIGWFETNGVGAPLAIEDNSVDGDSVARLGPGVWQAGLNLLLGSGVDSRTDKEIDPDSKSVVVPHPVRTAHCSVSSSKVKSTPVTEGFEFQELKPHREYRWWNPEYCKDVPDSQFDIDAIPQASGDFTVNLVSYDVTTAATSAISSTLVSAGTTSQSYTASIPFTLTDPSLVYVQVVPTGVETRTVSSGQVDYVNMNPNQ